MIELLAPAGSRDALIAAINGGADAVYLGGRILNARMRAKNFDDDAIREAIKLAHDSGVKVYITLNTLVYDRECDEAVRYACFLYSAGADALIITDRGLAQKLHTLLPDFPLHASTQLSGHNSLAAKHLAGWGFSRMVFARELSAENIKLLSEKSPIELEMFAHGALCVCHSGQCLCSWAMGGRSGNRGECAQPCRMKYNGGYPLSLKDNCLASHITKIEKLNISSLKLEGRLKSPDYVYAVTSTYRRLLDEKRNATPDELSFLADVFSRNGFTDGYFTGKISDKMLGVRDNSLPPYKTPNMKKIPVRREKIKLNREEVSLTDSKIIFPHAKAEKNHQYNARFFDKKSIPECAKTFFTRIYLPLDGYEKVSENCDGVIMPEVITDLEISDVKEKLKKAYAAGARHILVGNIGHIALAEEYGFILHGDYRLNITNCGSAELYSGYFTDFILSPELTLPRIRDIFGNKSVITYGRIPLMLLEKPVGCGKLKDERGVSFPIIRSGRRDLLLNSAPIWMGDREKELKEAFIFNRHFIFTTESKSEAEKIIKLWQSGKLPEGSYKRIGN